MTQETVTNGTEALFTREGMPPVKEMIPCALQHVLASFAGIITPAVIMAGVYGFNSQQSTDIIQVALILSAIDTALQAFAPFRRIGGGPAHRHGRFVRVPAALQAMAPRLSLRAAGRRDRWRCRRGPLWSGLQQD